MPSIREFVAAITLLLLPSLAFAGEPGQSRPEAADRGVFAHASRVVSPGEMCSAIRRALQSSGAPAGTLPSVGQLRPAVPVTVTVVDPGLRVLRIDPDVVPDSARVRLWTGKEPAIHPFDVRVLHASGLLRWLIRREGSAHPSLVFTAGVKAAGESYFAQRPAPKPPTLVFPGRTATLLLEQPDLQVRTPVMPLARGVSGQWIRVRNLSTGQILAAQVVGPGSLVTQF
jgi:Chaperone for flagella basal body P-ring formation